VRAACLLVSGLLLAGPSRAGPMKAVEHGLGGTALFREVALGPTVGASGLWKAGGPGARLSLGVALTVFSRDPKRAGAVLYCLGMEGEFQLGPGPLESTLVVWGSPVSWRWLSVGAFLGVGFQGARRVDLDRNPVAIQAQLNRALG